MEGQCCDLGELGFFEQRVCFSLSGHCDPWTGTLCSSLWLWDTEPSMWPFSASGGDIKAGLCFGPPSCLLASPRCSTLILPFDSLSPICFTNVLFWCMVDACLFRRQSFLEQGRKRSINEKSKCSLSGLVGAIWGLHPWIRGSQAFQRLPQLSGENSPEPSP